MSRKKLKTTSHSEDPHRQREQSRYERPIASREHILSVLRGESGPVDFEALADLLDLQDNDNAMEALRRRVGAMIRDGQLLQNRRRGLVPIDTDNLVSGRISAHADGFGFVIVDDGDKDIYLNGKQMKQVLHGDRVVVSVTGIDRRGRREGRIADVVERANHSLVGRLSIDRGVVVVLPDNKRIHQDLLIAPGELSGAGDGDMVVAEIIEQPSRRHPPVGKIVEVLGQHLRPGMEIDVALHSHGIPAQWPEAVLAEAAAFSTRVKTSAARGRKDIRDLALITIDGADARDFDDAVWCEPLDKGWRLMVAIADVANYVIPGSELDNEAIDRGTSVYFPGRVVPMLPEVLSNGLCSLNPDVDRLCMLCELTLNQQGKVKKVRFHNAIMRSHARLTYDQVWEMLSNKKSRLRKENDAVLPVIEELYKVYKVLANQRRKRGAIEFDSSETHIVFDEHKKIKEILPIQRNDAHKLIEECMILANIQAAAYLEERSIPALYRVHSGPKQDRLIDLRAFLALRGLSLGGGDSPSALDYAALAKTIADYPDRGVIQTVMLRSMQQAVYQPVNDGHFGLALEQYAHFTSPIRRYPDLLVHRAIKFAIASGKKAKFAYSSEHMLALGESCSMAERRAEEASRDVISWLKCEYMQEHVGSQFSGVISAVTSFGLFVELTGIHVEGLIHVTNLSRDYYRFDQAAQALIGERSGRRYHLGDTISVQVAAVNLEERKIDFNEVEGSVSSDRTAAQSRLDRKSGKQSSQSRITNPASDGVEKPVNKEKRRQDKRKLKQQRRDEKRASKLAEKNQTQRRRKRQKSDADLVRLASSPATEPVNNKQDELNGADPIKNSSNTRRRIDLPEADKKDSVTVTTKKTSGKKVRSKKVSSKNISNKKLSNKKTSNKKTSNKKITNKKANSKKTSGKKVARDKVRGKKVTAKKLAKKFAKKTSSAKKTLTKKATSKKTGSKSSAGKKKRVSSRIKKTAGKKAGKRKQRTLRDKKSKTPKKVPK